MTVERPKPVVVQVNEILRERIRNKIYSPGERLPSESDFATEFQVSRATVRTVLARLEVEGLIIRKQGDGTFVNERLEDVNAHLGGLWEFTRLIESSGYRPSIQAGVTVKRAATQAEAARLTIDMGCDVIAMQRVFFADERPVIVAHNTLATDLLVNDIAEIDSSKPIRQFMADYCQREIAYAT
ncbi:MAG: GntR family transcriptional regulator, partial [Anaerolineae bacterium]|nr:GntR family transcriptional regulator [Anaerolineae bacterium]